MAPVDVQRITLPGGRHVAIREFGERAGTPCLFFHGTGGSRISPQWTFPALTDFKSGIQLIAVDRPGYGHSAPTDGGFLDWGLDIGGLADVLGFRRFSIIATSMGAAYGYACSAQMPERVSTLAIVSGLAPLELGVPLTPDDWRDALFWRLAGISEGLTAVLWGWMSKALLSKANKDQSGFFEVLYRSLPDPDRVVMERALGSEQARAAFIADQAESHRQGGRAMAADLVKYSRPWGFELENIKADVHLWHGTEDSKVPFAMAKRVASVLPNCKTHFGPGGHLMGLDKGDAIAEVIRSAGR